jgi:hypothetical protein
MKHRKDCDTADSATVIIARRRARSLRPACIGFCEEGPRTLANNPRATSSLQAGRTGQSVPVTVGGPLTTVSQNGWMTPDSGVVYGHPVDPDLRKQSPAH